MQSVNAFQKQYGPAYKYISSNMMLAGSIIINTVYVNIWQVFKYA